MKINLQWLARLGPGMSYGEYLHLNIDPDRRTFEYYKSPYVDNSAADLKHKMDIEQLRMQLLKEGYSERKH